MKKIATEVDPFTGITEDFYYDDATDRVTINRHCDVEANINLNKDLFNEHDGVHYNDTNGTYKVATIPVILIEQWRNEQGFDWFNTTDKERRAWLNKPEHKFLKVRPGNL